MTVFPEPGSSQPGAPPPLRMANPTSAQRGERIKDNGMPQQELSTTALTGVMNRRVAIAALCACLGATMAEIIFRISHNNRSNNGVS